MKHSVTLIVSHEALDHAAVTELLGFNPTAETTKGESLGKAKAVCSTWVKGWRTSTGDMDSVLIEVRSALEPVRAQLRKIAETHELHISLAQYFPDAYGAFGLNSENLLFLAELNCEVAFIAYPSSQ